jgi:hypothetical protein
MLCAYRELSVRAKPASQKEGFGFRLLCLSCHPCSVSSSAPRLSNHPHITQACLSAARSPYTLITTVTYYSCPVCFRRSSLLVFALQSKTDQDTIHLSLTSWHTAHFSSPGNFFRAHDTLAIVSFVQKCRGDCTSHDCIPDYTKQTKGCQNNTTYHNFHITCFNMSSRSS